MITFNIFFKRINTNIILRFVSFLITINYDDRLRTLEEESKNITCPLNEEESLGDDLTFDCQAEVDEGKVINTVGLMMIVLSSIKKWKHYLAHMLMGQRMIFQLKQVVH